MWRVVVLCYVVRSVLPGCAQHGRTALMYAAMNGCTGTVRLLLEHNAAPNQRNIVSHVAVGRGRGVPCTM